ncbi:MAG: hypothetical protein SGI90_13940, partial [Candidatus Eisenbacteria bacterium]|nr:hypothetical protein [Candidatus Eisenbacteria bacterium]
MISHSGLFRSKAHWRREEKALRLAGLILLMIPAALQLELRHAAAANDSTTVVLLGTGTPRPNPERAGP